MFEKDYFMRIVDQIRHMLARIIGLKQTQNLDEAHAELENTANLLCGLGMEKLLQLPIDSIVSLVDLTVVPPQREEMLQLLGELLVHYGSLCEAQQKPREAGRAYEKSLLLFDHISEAAMQAQQQQLAPLMTQMFDFLDQHMAH